MSVPSISSLAGHTMLENVSWLDANWMFLGLFCGVLVFSWLLSSNWPGSLHDKLFNPVWCAYLAVPVYTLHQFEEHGYDIFGRRYMFGPVFNAGTGAKFGLEVHPRAITWINILGIWVVFPLWARMASTENGFYPATLAWGISVINGLMGHLLPFFLDEGDLRYVPGAVQSSLMVPLGLWILLVVFKNEGIIMGTVVPLVIGILWHVVGLQFPMLLVTSVSEDIRFPFWMAVASVLPLLAVTSTAFQKILSNQQGRDKVRLS